MKIGLQDLQRRIRRGPGLVVGPGLSTNNNRESECLLALKLRFPLKESALAVESAGYMEYVDHLRQLAAYSDAEIRDWFGGFFRNEVTRNAQLHGILGVHWSAIISLTSDAFFSEAMAHYLFERPSKRALTTVASVFQKPGLASTPCYALMGDIADKTTPCRLAISRAEYLTRKRDWAKLLGTMPDYVRSDPLIFLGTASIPERVLDFVDEMLRLSPKIPKYLVFLSGDPSLSNAALLNLIDGYCEIQEVGTTITEIAPALDPTALSVYSLPLFSEQEYCQLPRTVLERIDDQVLWVPKKADLKRTDKNERNRLLDILFRPTHPDWTPYALGMEFRRDICSEIGVRIKGELAFAKPGAPGLLLIVGEAGIGKTVAIRSVAFELAQADTVCFWTKKSYGEISGGRFDAVVQVLNKHFGKEPGEVVIFVDDPIGSRVSTDEMTRALKGATFKVVLVVCQRQSEAFLTEYNNTAYGSRIEIAKDFTAHEFEALPDYLVKLGISPNLDHANRIMPAPGARTSRDVLCALWYLLPQTKGAIEDSLTGEYFRLGGVDSIITNIASEGRSGIGLGKLHRAYEFVTAVSGMDNSVLPVEVLVSALRISYSDWTEQCETKRPVWGLLYEEALPAAETYAYRTRNSVVTEVLLRAINAGSIGYTGQFRLLKELLAACNSTSAPYRAFVFDILVNKRKLIQGRFTYDQAMELYDTALGAYPAPLGIVKHHQCLVKRALGGDPLSVYEELKRLIAVADDTAAGDNDSKVNLHTSAAAALTQAVKDAKVDAQEGASHIFEHIATVIILDQLSMHAHHVHASALIKLAAAIRDRDATASVLNLERASRIIDRALMLLRPLMPHGFSGGASVDLFENLYDEIAVAVHDSEEFKSKAFEMLEQFKNQSAIVLWLRLRLRNARRTNRGHDFKKVDEAIRDVFSRLEVLKSKPVIELRICRVELVVAWQLENGKGPIHWEQFIEDIEHILATHAHAGDAVWLFYLGVAFFNLNKFPEADVCFQKLRVMRLDREFLRPLRCFYIADKSVPQVLQGIIGDSGGYQRYIYSSSLGVDVPIRHGEFRENSDEVQHFKIGFNLTGPLAVGLETDLDLALLRKGPQK